MTEAPERIWINKVHGQHPEDWNFTDGVHLTKAQLRKKVEYIRADLVDPKAIREAALREAADELKGWGYNTAVRAILALIEKEKTK